MTKTKRKMPADTAWPPAGIRDLKPDIPISDSADHVRFPTLREALKRESLKQTAPTTQVSPDTLTQQRVLDMQRRTRSRTVKYLCRAYLQFGQATMSAKDLEILCAAINATP